MKNDMNKKAVVLLSGGIDSSVCLALAKSQGFQCHALSLNYNQRNLHELFCAEIIAQQIGVSEHRIIKCELGAWGGSSLTDNNMSVDSFLTPHVNTYVPARNTIFLSLALSWAETVNATHIFFAANAEDDENYPDCRPEFFNAFTRLAQLATRAGTESNQFNIHTPLITLSKKQIIQLGKDLNVDLNLTFSCYDPVNINQPCQQCVACHLRNEGFAELVE